MNLVPPPAVTEPEGRLFTCTDCGALIEVFELPEPFLAPDEFACGECMLDPEPRPARSDNDA